MRRPEPRGKPIFLTEASATPHIHGRRIFSFLPCYIGWSPEARHRNIRFLAYSTRFLILPWLQVEHLASHILSRMAKRRS